MLSCCCFFSSDCPSSSNSRHIVYSSAFVLLTSIGDVCLQCISCFSLLNNVPIFLSFFGCDGMKLNHNKRVECYLNSSYSLSWGGERVTLFVSSQFSVKCSHLLALPFCLHLIFEETGWECIYVCVRDSD